MSNTPNLFDFATSELSQDAVLAYLFAWADQKYKADNEKLYLLGRELIDEVVKAAVEERASDAVKTTEQLHELQGLGAYTHVHVRRQLDKIDIVIFLDPEFESPGDDGSKVKSSKAALLIEDKVFTSEHSGQLKKYLSGFDYGVPKDSVYPIFYKTGLQAGYEGERKAGFAQYSRINMVELLGRHKEALKIDTTLYQYHSYLKGLTAKYAVGRVAVPKSEAKDSGFAWQGFMHELAGKLTTAQGLHWQYVPNAQGGFFGMWWGFTKISNAKTFTHPTDRDYSGVDVYLQLEEDTLTLRAGRWEGEKISSAMRKDLVNFMEVNLKKPLEKKGYSLHPSGRTGRSCRLVNILEEGSETTFAAGAPIEAVAETLRTITAKFNKAIDFTAKA